MKTTLRRWLTTHGLYLLILGALVAAVTIAARSDDPFFPPVSDLSLVAALAWPVVVLWRYLSLRLGVLVAAFAAIPPALFAVVALEPILATHGIYYSVAREIGVGRTLDLFLYGFLAGAVISLAPLLRSTPRPPRAPS